MLIATAAAIALSITSCDAQTDEDGRHARGGGDEVDEDGDRPIDDEDERSPMARRSSMPLASG
jgi:hypothetical protein